MTKMISLAAALALGLAGCQIVDGPLLNETTSESPVVPPRLSDKIDGNYKGKVTLVTSHSPACPGNSYGKLEIGDRRLSFAYRPDAIFVVAIQPDGSLHAVAGPSVLDGALRDGRLQFSVQTPICLSRYDFRRVL